MEMGAISFRIAGTSPVPFIAVMVRVRDLAPPNPLRKCGRPLVLGALPISAGRRSLPSQRTRTKGGPSMIIEMRTYTLQPGTLAEAESASANRRRNREKLSKLAAFWHTEVGPLNQIIDVWAYDSSHRASVRAAASKEANWPPPSANSSPTSRAKFPRTVLPAAGAARDRTVVRDPPIHADPRIDPRPDRAMVREARGPQGSALLVAGMYTEFGALHGCISGLTRWHRARPIPPRRPPRAVAGAQSARREAGERLRHAGVVLAIR